MRHRNVFTRVLVGAGVFAVLGVGAVVAQDSRTFGPDTTSVGVFTGQGTTTPGLTCDAPPAPAARTCTGFLASSLDGTLLDVTVRVPQSAPPHPLVVYVHGWGGSKGSGREYEDRLTAAGLHLSALLHARLRQVMGPDELRRRQRGDRRSSKHDRSGRRQRRVAGRRRRRRRHGRLVRRRAFLARGGQARVQDASAA